jgi:hypothetical protein
MSIASNKYATKIFSEHPIATWPLDDDAYFISLIENKDRNLSLWTLQNCSVGAPTISVDPSPFNGGHSPYIQITGNNVTLSPSGGTIYLESEEVFSFSELDPSLANFSINFYLYQASVYCESYEFGFRYFDTVESQYKEVLSYKSASPISEWIRFNETFEIPQANLEPCQLVIKINVSGGGSPGTYNFIMDALSVGQWSEMFSSKSLGSNTESLPASLSLSGLKGISAEQYGPLSDNAYYLSDGNYLLAKNSSVPMVYGSENCTILLPGNQTPSLVFPGKGLLSKSGQYEIYSLEFWLRIKPNTKEDRKIFGTVDSSCDYGIYVSEGFLTLKVGNNVASHNINEWYRPMLVHLIYGEGNAQILINGEQVINIPIDKESLSLPVENEWLGFFSYEDIDLFEIDCISIYPYIVPQQVAKRRMVWGQGVASQEVVDSFFKGSSTAMSFPNANYSANIVYPDKERWDAGYYNNLVATSNSISVPKYSLPEIFIGGRNQDLWYESNNLVNNIEYPDGIHPKFFTFRPGTNEAQTAWIRNGDNWTEKCYLKFNNANLANAPISAIYGVFEIEDNISEERPLIHIVNSLTNKRFEINIYESTISYKFDNIELYDIDASGQEHIIAGIHIPTVTDTFGYDLSTFFSSYDFLQIYVGGSEDTFQQTFETFEGKIYKIAFADSTNYEEISEHFNDDGFANYDDDSFFISHFSTYALKPFYKFNKFFLDISVSSYWEEYFPLSFFAKYSLDADLNPYYGFDFVQFNIDYPSVLNFVDLVENQPTWENYISLDQEYSYPIQKGYAIFDNSSITNYLNYQDLDNNTFLNGGEAETEIFDNTFDGGNSLTSSFTQTYDGGNSVSTEIVTKTIDSSESSVNIFATFQLIAEGANEILSSFVYTKELPINKVVNADKENTVDEPYRAYRTKFNIVDGSIIYPPKNIKTEDLAMAIHFSVKHDAILTNPLKIRNMELSSKSLNVYEPNAIGTKFGNNIYPYVKNGIYYNYKEKNPFHIYKDNNPYLYLTSDSGIKVLNYSNESKQYSISVPINDSLQNDFHVGAIQLFAKYDIDEVVPFNLPILEIQNFSETIELVIDKDLSNLRYKVFARNKNSKEIYNNVKFYQNGIEVQNPYLIKQQWTAIGMVFEDPINFSASSGSINILGGCYFDNISVFRSEGLNETAAIIPNVWNKILTQNGVDDLNWGYWYDENGSSYVKKWKDIYVLAEEQVYSLSAADIYSAYLGTNTNVVDDDSGISITNDECSVFSEVSWLTYAGKPA